MKKAVKGVRKDNKDTKAVKKTVSDVQPVMTAQAQKPVTKKRDSNLELFRIITMLLIIAHHFVVNSGLKDMDGPISSSPFTFNSLFLLIFGAWGKIGINCFVMITGYFMCKMDITVKKFAKLFFEVMFYRIAIQLVFWISGYEPFSVVKLALTLIPITDLTQDFTQCFLIFFLFIPFLNTLINHISERMHIGLIFLCGLTYVLLGTVRGGPFAVDMNYVSWFMVIYVIASYIRLYPKKWTGSTARCGVLFFLSVIVAAASVIGCTVAGERFGRFAPYYLVSDSNSFLALITGVFGFLFFKNIKIPYSKFINMVAASSFGVLLIHTHSDSMRKWLWEDVLDNVGHFGDKLMPLYAIGSVIVIFAVCTVIDILRINLLEKPFFRFWDNKMNGFIEKIKGFGDRIFRKMNIE